MAEFTQSNMKYLSIFFAVVASVIAQDAPPPLDDRPVPPAAEARPPRGFGPPGGMMQSERKIVKQVDKDGESDRTRTSARRRGSF